MPGQPSMSMQAARRAPLFRRRVATIQELLRKRAREVAALDERIARARKSGDERIAHLDHRLSDLLNKVFGYADAHWETLAGTARSFTMEGTLIWRKTTDAGITVDSRQQEQVIAALRQLGLHDCIKTVDVVDTGALLDHLDQVAGIEGVNFTPADESFGVKPVKGAGLTNRVSALRAALPGRRTRPHP